MPDDPHDLKLAILAAVSFLAANSTAWRSYLEALVLQDALDGGIFTAW